LTFSGLVALALLMCAPVAARADDFFADLDRDGVRDIVTIPKAPERGLWVWLSSSKRLLRLPTRRPIMGVTTRDLDGDGRLDLVAADTASIVHVWHRTAPGHLKVTRRRHALPSQGSAHPRRLDRASDSGTPAIAPSASSDVTCDTDHPAAPTPDGWGLVVDATLAPAGSHAGPPHDPRGPPPER